MEANAVVQALAAGRPEEVKGALSEEFAQELPDGELTRIWQEAIRQLGEFVAAGEPLRLYDVPLSFAGGDAHLQLAYKGVNITGLMLRPGPPTGTFGH